MRGARALSGCAWPAVAHDTGVLVPVGSTEQHGPHLPFTVDGVIADALATRAAAAAGGHWIVAPTVWFGSSGEHQGFPGTLSIGQDALALMLVELVRSAATWATRIVFVNGHGGNARVLTAAVTRMREEGHDVAWVPCAIMGDAHAGRVETSLMLHLAPEAVDLAAARAGNTEPLATLLPVLEREGVRAVSPNGVLGDPAGATADEGRALLDDLVDRTARALDDGVVGAHGLLLGGARA